MSGLACYVVATTIVRARRPIDAAVVGSVRARRCPARYGKFGSGLETTPVQARFPIDAGGVGCVTAGLGELCLVQASCVGSWRVQLRNHARAGTGLDQRQRRGMDFGPVWRGVLLHAVASHGPPRRVMAGRGSKTTTRSARFRLRRRMVGCTTEWCGGLMLVMARHGRAFIAR